MDKMVQPYLIFFSKINHDTDKNGGDILKTICEIYSFLCNNKLNGGRTYTNGILQIEGQQAGALISE